eukprot:s91_g46.t1
MSERWAPWTEFTALRAEVSELRHLCQVLQARVSELEQHSSGSGRASEFELITEPPAAEDICAAVAAGADLPAERVRAAEKIGAWIKRCLQNEHRGLSGREEIPLATKLYIVVRDIRGQVYNPPKGDLDEPEELGPRHNLITSGETVEFAYQAGVLSSLDPPATCALVAVAEVDGRLLVAVPEGAWHKTRRKRKINPDLFSKVIAVFVPCCDADQREVPDSTPSTKIWLGLLSGCRRPSLLRHGATNSVTFPIGADGLMRLPFASAVVAAAKDHYTFLSADSGGVAEPPGLGGLESRFAAIEEQLQRLLHALPQTGAAAGASAELGRRPKAAARPALPAGIDPAVAQQALQAGISPSALVEIAKSMGLPAPTGHPSKTAAVVKDSSGEEESEEEDPVALALKAGGASGAADPMQTAVLQLTKLMTNQMKEKGKKKDRELEQILDRAESGSAKDLTSGSTRSKAAALLSLRSLLQKNPKLLYTAIESRLQEDWEQASLQPGVQQAVISARGWLEHRSHIQNYGATVRAAWCLGGIWDCLRTSRVEEARARTALAVCLLDQQACDNGSFLLAGEMTLESPPPFQSFTSHVSPTPWELPHSKLIDPRWFDLVVSKVRDLADFQEKKAKLSQKQPFQKPSEEAVPKAKPKAKNKGKGSQKGKAAASEEPPPAAVE